MYWHLALIYNRCLFSSTLLKTKVPKGGFCSDAIEKTFLKPFCEQFLKEPFFICVKNIWLIWRLFSTGTGKVPWMLNVLDGTVIASKQPLFLRV